MDYQGKAKWIVRCHVDQTLDKSDPPVDYEVYVVWFSKTLQNWKALLITTLPDGNYYEVTYNGDQGESYLDTYVKVNNMVVMDTAIPDAKES